MAEIDHIVESKTGLSVYDLPDCPFREWFDNGKKASSAANKAIKMGKE